MRLFQVLGLILLASPSFAAQPTEPVVPANEPIVSAAQPDTFFVLFEYDGDFPTCITTTWRHAWSNESAILTSFLLDAFDQTLGLIISYDHMFFGALALRPGIVTTFGTGSWNGSIDKRTYVFRDVGPSLDVVFDSERFHFETSNLFLVPTQESYDTAVWLAVSRFMAAIKWNEFGIGPRFELYYSKEGTNPFKIVETRIGGSVFKHWEKTSIEFFLGYNPTSTTMFLGKPLPAAPVFRVSFAQAF